MGEITSNAMASLVEAHIGHIGEDMILSEIDDIKSDYLDLYWQDVFDSAEEAYAEQGSGEAETEVLKRHARDILGKKANSSTIGAFMHEMANQLGVSLH
jgi:hypothetical protein